MLLKTRTAMPKFRLFRKFKIDFFDSFSRGARVTRRYSLFNLRRIFRYKFRYIMFLKKPIFYEYLVGASNRFFYRKLKRILKRFTLFRTSLKRKHKFLARRLVENIILSNGVRTSISSTIFSSQSNFVEGVTPTTTRFGALYNFKKG